MVHFSRQKERHQYIQLLISYQLQLHLHILSNSLFPKDHLNLDKQGNRHGHIE